VQDGNSSMKGSDKLVSKPYMATLFRA
jgi:hypothetical protein